MKKPSDYPCLLSSILHWEANARLYRLGKPFSNSPYECACCNEIMKRAENNKLNCHITDENGEFICPIYAYTELGGCMGTPYQAVTLGYAGPQNLADWLTALYQDKEPELVDEHNKPKDRENMQENDE